MKTFNKEGRVRQILDAKAEEFSNFEDVEFIEDDDFENFEDFMNGGNDDYIGANDEFLDYGGVGATFAAHNQGFRTASIQITATASNTVSKLQLFGDLLAGAANPNYPMIKEGTIAEVSGTPTITGQGSPKSMNQLLAWLQYQPTILQGMQIATAETTILSSIIERYETSPFRDMATDPINLSVFRNEYQYQSTLLTIPKINQVIGNQNYWYITIPTGKAFTMTINLYFGVSLNTSTALQNKMLRANANILRMGGDKVVNALTTGTINGVGNTAMTTNAAKIVKTTSSLGSVASKKVSSAKKKYSGNR